MSRGDQSVCGLGKEGTNSGIGDGSMLMTILQMRQQMMKGNFFSIAWPETLLFT